MFFFCCVNYLNFGLPWFSVFDLVYGKSFLFCWKISPILHNNVPKSVCLVLVIKHYLRWIYVLIYSSARMWNLNFTIYDNLLLYKNVFFCNACILCDLFPSLSWFWSFFFLFVDFMLCSYVIMLYSVSESEKRENQHTDYHSENERWFELKSEKK